MTGAPGPAVPPADRPGRTTPSIWVVPGMAALLVVAFTGFSGYAALLPVAPLWAVHGGADTAGAGLVNFVLLGATVATQFFVPAMIRALGWGHVLALGMVLLGVPALAHVLRDDLPTTLALSGVRGVGFGILTVAASAAAVLLVPVERRGAAVGAYSAALSVPNVLLMPAAAFVAQTWGFGPVFLVSALPLLGIPACYTLARHLPDRATHDRAHPEPPLLATGRRGRLAPYLGMVSPTLILLAITLAGGALITFAPQMVERGWVAAGGLFAMGLLSALTRWRIGQVADRVGAGPLIWPFVALAVVGLAVIAWLVRDRLGTADVAAWLAACALLGISYGALQNLTLLQAFHRAGPRRVGAASAVWNAGFDTGTAVGSVLVGAVAVGWGFGVGMGLTAALVLLTLPLALRSRAD